MQLTQAQQQFFMQWAISLGEKGRLTAPPNPWVGCVIVKEGEIVGEGFHECPGSLHAEAMALEAAGPLAKGATAFVSLEPCSHHGRTPPCVKALIETKIATVVIPFSDPDPQVSGEGVKALRAAGIEVIENVCIEEAKRSLAPYIYHRQKKIPYCVLKSAISLDGRTAAQDGSSKWITGEEARRDVALLRAQSQAVMVGAKTALMDQPRLTVRHVDKPFKAPLRVVLDPNGIVPPKGPLFEGEPTLIFTSPTTPKETLIAWAEKRAEIIVNQTPGKIDLKEVLATLGDRGVLQLLVEGGSTLLESFVQARLANRFVAYLGATLLGIHGKPLLPHLEVPSMEQAPRLVLDEMHRFGTDVRLDYHFL